jgi:guanyl-specific ribonuclease Sa
MALSYRLSLSGWAALLLSLLFFFTLRACSKSNSGGGPGWGFTQRPPSDPGSGSGITTLAFAELPKHVQRVVEHLRTVKHFRPLRGYKGGRAFRNREGLLPKQRNYYEFDVHPFRPERSRGAERLVVDESKRFFYYTRDHYRTFTQIRLP